MDSYASFLEQTLVMGSAHILLVLTVVAAAANDLIETRNERKRRFREPGRGEAYVNELRHAPPQRMKEALRMVPSQFNLLISNLEADNDYPLRKLTSASTAQQLAIFLYFVAGGARYRTIGELFGCGSALISRSIHRVLQSLCSLYKRSVDLPGGEVPAAIRSNPKFYPFFEGCVGAIDGSLIPISVQGVTRDELAPWRSRKGTMSQNVLAAVDFNMNFRYILSGWEGSAHDGQVLTAAREQGFKAPPGCYYLADAGYSANSDLLLTPYQKTRYHLREQGIAREKPANEQELFNLRHAQLRNVVERVFGVFKRRFAILEAPRRGLTLRTQAKLIYALAYLHNFLNCSGSDPFAEAEALPVDGPEEVITGTPDDGDASRRDRMAKEMWEDYQRVLELRERIEMYD